MMELFALCAPDIAPQTLTEVIRVESRGNPLAININGPIKLPRPPLDAADAVALVRPVIAAGYSVDLGLMQVNSRNLPQLGVTLEQMFDPCTNLRAGAAILAANYAEAARRQGPGQPALLAALSAYNTGDFARGFRNGYVAKYTATAPAAVPPADAASPLFAPTTIYRRTTDDAAKAPADYHD